MLIRLLLALFLLSPLNAFAGHIHILATLSPAGSLEIQSDELLGQLVKDNEAIKAKVIFVKIDSLDSGIVLRNEHIHKYLGLEKFKKISLSNVLISDNKGVGTLDLNGVKNKIEFEVKKVGKNLTSTFKVDRNTHKLPKAEFMGVSVDDNVVITVTFPMKDVAMEKSK